MKKLVLFAFSIFLFGGLMAQTPLTMEPANATAWDEVTLYLDVSLSCPDSALLMADSVMMHSGLTIDDAGWQNTIEFNAMGANGQQPKLVKMASMSPAISISPAGAGAWDEITLTVNTNLSCPEGALLAAENVMMHSGVTLDGAGWSNTVAYDGMGANGQSTALTSNGDGTWSITFVPAAFYGLEEGADVTGINAVFNGGDWTMGEAKAYDGNGNCTDFYVPFGENHIWTITYVPAEFYGIEEGTNAQGINLVFNGGDWSAGEAKDFNETGACTDFYLPFTAPSDEIMIADFEDGTAGPLTLHVMGNGEWDNGELHEVSETFEVIDNPDPSGLNWSSKVMKFNRRGLDEGGQPWGGFWANVDPAVDVTTHKYVHVMVWKPRISPVRFKLEGGPSGTLEMVSSNEQTEVNMWVDMVFKFDTMTGAYPVVAFMPDFEDPFTAPELQVIYFDNIRVNSDPNPADNTSIFNPTTNASLAVYPNPVTSSLFIDLNNDAQSIGIYNLLGQQQATFSNVNAGTFSFSTSDLPKGIYMVVMRDKNNKQYTAKFVKE
ncbi:MAG: T9SS type A sorting domain-containing protein [Clostridia bacterium]|nr:T9SS type A sorting domain-containing protein [Clostridia bacterium]